MKCLSVEVKDGMRGRGGGVSIGGCDEVWESE